MGVSPPWAAAVQTWLCKGLPRLDSDVEHSYQANLLLSKKRSSNKIDVCCLLLNVCTSA